MTFDTFLLSEDEEAIFLGNLLGDGHIQKRGNSYRTKIQHSKSQEDYVLWKYEKLKRLCEGNRPPKSVATKQGQSNVLFYLRSGYYLEKYHNLFYDSYIWTPPQKKGGSPKFSGLRSFEGKPFLSEKLIEVSSPKVRYRKVIRQTLIEYLPRNPLVLAVWFLDDGSCRKDVFGGRIATQGFSKEEQHFLQSYLKEGFGIQTQLVLHSRLKDQYYISIPSKNGHFSRFVDLIKPIVAEIPSLNYKISNPRND